MTWWHSGRASRVSLVAFGEEVDAVMLTDGREVEEDKLSKPGGARQEEDVDSQNDGQDIAEHSDRPKIPKTTTSSRIG